MKMIITITILLLAKYPVTTHVLLFENNVSVLPQSLNKIPKRMFDYIQALTIKDIQKISGHKLSLSEKLNILLLKHRLKRIAKNKRPYEADAGKQASISFILGIITIGLLLGGNILTGVAFLAIIPIFGLLALWFGLKSARNGGKTFKNMFGIIVGGLVVIAGVIIGISALTAF